MTLEDYESKRDFSATPEPTGGKSHGQGLRYCIQRHEASRLHFDFRLELDGALKSWAVPKGPSLDPAEKRLAVQVEDHPLDYGDFEGTIPPGQYGAGTVIVWDDGEWEPEGDAHESLADGKLTFHLHGERLKGRWSLVQMSGNDWLLIKSDDSEAQRGAGGEITDQHHASVLTGRTNQDLENAPMMMRGVELTSPAKVLWPEQGATKRELARYYQEVADWILPFVADRPLTLVRCPQGQAKTCFYQKHHKPGLPDPVGSVTVTEKDGTDAQYVCISDLSGLIGLVQVGSLELHPWLARADRLDRPDKLVFDLDPGPDTDFGDVVEAARRVRALLDEAELVGYPMLSGGKGVHVVVPLVRRAEWEEAGDFAEALARRLAQSDPERYVVKAAKSARKGRIFIDYLRNRRGATSVAPYSTRARQGAPVATPIRWDELAGARSGAVYDIESVLKRLASLDDDPWAGFHETRQSITKKALAAVGTPD